jgi:hypothetical protein
MQPVLGDANTTSGLLGKYHDDARTAAPGTASNLASSLDEEAAPDRLDALSLGFNDLDCPAPSHLRWALSRVWTAAEQGRGARNFRADTTGSTLPILYLGASKSKEEAATPSPSRTRRVLAQAGVFTTCQLTKPQPDE